MKLTLKNAIMTMTLLVSATVAYAQTATKTTLTIDGAKKVIASSVAYAKKNNAPGGVIAVVDDGGNLMALERLDGTFAAGANISIGKARTAVLFKRPTKVFEDIIKNGRTAMVALPDSLFTPLQGGIPIIVDGQIVAGVGVSGASSAQQDEEIALAGASVFGGDTTMSGANNLGQTSKGSVLFFSNERVAGIFLDGFSAPGWNQPELYDPHEPTRQAGTCRDSHARYRHHLCNGRHSHVRDQGYRSSSQKKLELIESAARALMGAIRINWSKET